MYTARRKSFAALFFVFTAALGFAKSPTVSDYPSPFDPPFPLFTPTPYKLSWDIDMSPYAGGEDVLFVHRSCERIGAFFTQKNPVSYSKKTFARVWRLSDLVMVWLPLNYLAMVVQHEIFGHGYRIRSIGSSKADVTGYSFDTPPPYGGGGGITYYNVGENLTTTEASAIATGGVESTAILAWLTKVKWIESGKIDPRQAILYLLSEHDLGLYVGSLKAKDTDLSGHDIHSYIESLNYTYPSNLLSKGHLRTLSWINLADVFTLYAVYSWFRYIASGEQGPIPMIANCYLPGLRMGLAPFGPEFFIENFFRFNEKPFYAYLKGGYHAGNHYYGLGGYAPRLLQLGNWFFGFRLDLWRQPKLLLEPASTSIFDIDFDAKPSKSDPLYPYSEQREIRYGTAASLIFFYKVHEVWGLEAEGGYKTKGYLPGYSLTSSAVARFGLVLEF